MVVFVEPATMCGGNLLKAGTSANEANLAELKPTRNRRPSPMDTYIWVCVFLTWPCREVGIRGMNRRYGSGYGSGV